MTSIPRFDNNIVDIAENAKRRNIPPLSRFLRLANRARGKRSLHLRANRLRLSYVEATKWCKTIRTMPIVADGALSLNVVDAELSSASKVGSRVDPVSLRDP